MAPVEKQALQGLARATKGAKSIECKQRLSTLEAVQPADFRHDVFDAWQKSPLQRVAERYRRVRGGDAHERAV